MALGRIKSHSRKAHRSPYGPLPLSYKNKRIGVRLFVRRNMRELVQREGGRYPAISYVAEACITRPSKIRGSRGVGDRCAPLQVGRSVQSAVAKALKALSQTVARRGRK